MINLTQIIKTHTTPNVELKAALVAMLEQSRTLEEGDRWPAMRLVEKITEQDRFDPSDAEDKILRKAIKGHPFVPAIYTAMEFMLWPGDLAESDREFMERRHNEGGNGTTKPPDETGAEG